MKPLEKIKLIDDIGRELQSRMTFSEIDSYFETYGIPTDHEPSYNSKYVYVKETLPKISDKIILEIASELEIKHNVESNSKNVKENEATFWKPGHFRLFVSHIASFKKIASVLKKDLEKYGINAFIAHVDIEPTKEWQTEIEKGLFSMDALCALLMPGFKESNWTDQEVGVAVGRDVLIIPIRKNMDPYGFIGKYQGLQAVGKNVGEVANGIFRIIATNKKTKSKYLNTLIELLLLSNSVNQGVDLFSSLNSIEEIPKEKVEYLKERIIENQNLRNTKILTLFNELAKPYGLSTLYLKDFDKRKQDEYDDLPF